MNLMEREQALLKLVAGYGEEECHALLDAARAESARLIADAYRRQGARLHARVLAERSNARARIHAARSERETRLRASRERANARLLELAWPRLAEALQSRWSDPKTRRLWTGYTIWQAGQSLPPGLWRIRHPPDWAVAERTLLRARLLRELSQAPHFLADGALSAGLVIESGDALLDTSLEGLLRDRQCLEARLLALLTPMMGQEPES